MFRQQEYLIPAAIAEDDGGGGPLRVGGSSSCRLKQQRMWKRKVTKSKSSQYSTHSIGNSRLLENFSRFLATRNVITNNNNDSTESLSTEPSAAATTTTTSHYDKLVSQPDDLYLMSSQVNHNNGNINRHNSRQQERHHHHQHQQQQQQQQIYMKKQRKNCQDHHSYDRGRFRKHGHRTVWMLGKLISPTSKSNKKSLLMNLIKAPTVLAALFSLLLVVTLIVLYALSFNHHQSTTTTTMTNAINSRIKLRVDSTFLSNEEDLKNLDSSSSSSSGSSGNHRLSNRDLPEELKPALAESIYDHHEDENDEDDYQNNEEQGEEDEKVDGLPEGLGRALSVQTECGLLIGKAVDSGVVFREIPYASPPIGERRWQRPQPIWLDRELCNLTETTKARSAERMKEARRQTSRGSKGVRSGTERIGTGRRERAGRERRGRQRHCAQLNPITNRFIGQEDCLYLDIYLPRLEQTKRLPVMVYIHGGFLAFGSSSGQLDWWMKAKPSARLAAELDVIVVAFNYRLQALGFMTLPQLTSESATNKPGSGSSSSGGGGGAGRGNGEEENGNFGLWDQLTALNWIKRNIESFGGDPNNIVLFGPDSASSLVWALMGNSLRQTTTTTPTITQIDTDTDTGTGTASTSASASSILNAHRTEGDSKENLFRAAWLTNPTIFYDLPHELAGQHYQRLFQNQSACLEANSVAAEKALAQSGRIQNLTSQDKDSIQKTTTTTREKDHKENNLKDCLMQLSAEQVIRHYLGNDHPSYRLDDQNSLPIHGIFVDQFVTIDGELVRDSFPFKATTAPIVSDYTRRSPTISMKNNITDNDASRCTTMQAQTDSDSPPVETNLPKSSSSSSPSSSLQKPHSSSSSSNGDEVTSHYAKGSSGEAASQINEITRRDNNGNVSGLGATTGQQRNKESDCSRPQHHNQDVLSSSSSSSSSLSSLSSTQQQPPPTTNQVRLNYPLDTIDLLIGSTAQAVEQWPCPRNLNQWSWDDFKRYVATSLNSFATDLYRRASSLYDVPKLRAKTNNNSNNNNNKHQQQHQERLKQTISGSPAWTYLTMVSDIRQICPINELTDNLRAGGARVYRYIVESTPTNEEPTTSAGKEDPTRVVGNSGASVDATDHYAAYASLDNMPSGRPKYAYHTKDLAAFFGYEFDSTFRPQTEDLKFQSKIRQMVRQFVHKQPTLAAATTTTTTTTSNNGPATTDGDGKQITILDGNGEARYVDKYRDTQCSMWRRNLGKSYAWLS